MTTKKKKTNVAEDLIKAITPRMIIISTLSAGGAMLAMLLAIYAGMKVGIVDASNHNEAANSRDVAVINISYNSQSYHFASNELCLSGEASQCLMNQYSASDKDYAIIKSNDQLSRMVNIMNSYSGAGGAYSVNIPEDFFYSGSVVAIVKEDKKYDDLVVTNVYRDEKYNLHVDAKVDESANPDANVASAHVVLLSIPNIQPKEVYLSIKD